MVNMNKVTFHDCPKKELLKIFLKSKSKYSLKFKLLHLKGKEKKTFLSLS